MPDVLRILIYRPISYSYSSYPSPAEFIYHEEVLFHKRMYAVVGEAKGLPASQYGKLSIVPSYKCERCPKYFFISDWDLDGLKHECTEPK